MLTVQGHEWASTTSKNSKLFLFISEISEISKNFSLYNNGERSNIFKNKIIFQDKLFFKKNFLRQIIFKTNQFNPKKF